MTIFSDSINKNGIVEQARDIMRVDAAQWPTQKIVNSVNNWLDYLVGFAIQADMRFQWDDTNHTKLPIGTTNLVANQAEYSFLTDEQGNKIITLTRIDILDLNGNWQQLQLIDQADIPMALDAYEKTAGTPLYYDKTADNIIKLYPKPSTNITAGLKFYFQRTPSYFLATDTTKEPGVSPILHRGFIIAAANDGAGSLGLSCQGWTQGQLQMEEQKVITYFSGRNRDTLSGMRPYNDSNR